MEEIGLFVIGEIVSGMVTGGGGAAADLKNERMPPPPLGFADSTETGVGIGSVGCCFGMVFS